MCLFPACSPRQSSANAAVGGLEPPPAGRLRRAYLHLPCSTASRSPTYIELLSASGTQQIGHEKCGTSVQPMANADFRTRNSTLIRVEDALVRGPPRHRSAADSAALAPGAQVDCTGTRVPEINKNRCASTYIAIDGASRRGPDASPKHGDRQRIAPMPTARLNRSPQVSPFPAEPDGGRIIRRGSPR